MAVEKKEAQQVDEEFLRRQERFGGEVREVAESLAPTVYDANDKPKETGNPGVIIHVMTDEGIKNVQVLITKPFNQDKALANWAEGSLRGNELMKCGPGGSMTYKNHRTESTYIVTTERNNIEIIAVQSLDGKAMYANANAVSKLLGVNHGDAGRFSVEDDGSLTFQKLSSRT